MRCPVCQMPSCLERAYPTGGNETAWWRCRAPACQNEGAYLAPGPRAECSGCGDLAVGFVRHVGPTPPQLACGPCAKALEEIGVTLEPAPRYDLVAAVRARLVGGEYDAATFEGNLAEQITIDKISATLREKDECQ